MRDEQICVNRNNCALNFGMRDLSSRPTKIENGQAFLRSNALDSAPRDRTQGKRLDAGQRHPRNGSGYVDNIIGLA